MAKQVINAREHHLLMHRALFLTILMLAAPLVALASNVDVIDESVILEEDNEALNSAKVATNPLGWEWVAKDTDAGFVWTRSVAQCI